MRGDLATSLAGRDLVYSSNGGGQREGDTWEEEADKFQSTKAPFFY